MKDTDKVTLTVRQLKRLLKESTSISSIKKLANDILFQIEEDNFPENMRAKWSTVKNVNRNSATIQWITQEEFDDYDFETFVEEVRRAAEFFDQRYCEKSYGIVEPITLNVEAVCRDGKWLGYGNETITVPL
jgi:hypothetical protein